MTLVERIRVPDSVTFAGARLIEQGQAVLAWGADFTGFWRRGIGGADTAWSYVEPEGWQGTIGVLNGEAHGEMLVVDSSGAVAMVSGRATGSILEMTRAERSRREDGWRLVAITGIASSSSYLEGTADQLFVSSGSSRGPAVWSRSDGMPPLLLARSTDGEVGVLPRKPTARFAVVRNGALTHQGAPIGDARALTSILSDSDRDAEWIVASGVTLRDGELVSLADLKSDRRILVRLDEARGLVSCRVIETPFAIAAVDEDAGRALAGVWDAGDWLMVYAITRQAGVTAREPTSCAV
jgi:hypothetical protein